MKRMFQLMAALLVLAALVSCKSAPKPEKKDLYYGLLGDWQPTVIVSAAENASLEKPVVSFRDNGDVFGYTGVNNFNTIFRITPEKSLKINPIIKTRRGGTPEAMALENAFETALTGAARFEADGGILTIYGADGAEVMQLKKLPPKAAQ